MSGWSWPMPVSGVVFVACRPDDAHPLGAREHLREGLTVEASLAHDEDADSRSTSFGSMTTREGACVGAPGHSRVSIPLSSRTGPEGDAPQTATADQGARG